MCKPSERAALLKFKHALTYFDHNVSSSWVGEECCNWERVTCGYASGLVLQLDLIGYDSSTNLIELGNTESLVYLLQLTQLQDLDLSFNNLRTNTISASLGNLVTLTHLDLSYNMFSDEILASLVNLSNLEILDLSSNNLSSIPSSYKFPPNLEFLSINNNQLSGQIPISIGQLTKLETLDISDNPMEGTVLSELHFANLSSLTYLHIQDTYLTLDMSSDWVSPFQLESLFADNCKINGQFPPWLQNHHSLSMLYLSNANISGIMPTWFHTLQALFGVDLSNNHLSGSPIFPINFYNIDLSNNSLSRLCLSNDSHQQVYLHALTIGLSNNQIDGPIPRYLGQMMPLLTVLDLSNNQINGPIPRYLGQMMPKLSNLDISNNHINGTIPKSLCRLTWLSTLAIQNNSLTGVIPNCWANTSKLSLVNLSYNKLNGRIPCFYSRGVGMDGQELQFYLHLNDNMLSGEIPSCLSQLSNLDILDVGGNQLSGKIPEWFSAENYGTLKILRLRGNNLSGIIPSHICSLSHLQLLDLGHNRLTGSIPSCLSNLTGMTSLDVSSDYEFEDVNEVIQGIERAYTSTLPYLVDIDLSCNYFVGSIPEDITNLTILLSLNLSYNQLSGIIPRNMGGLKSLISLDLSNNKLGGMIPTSMADLYSLSHLNLSYNNLSGPIPTGNQLQTLTDPTIYAGNSYLCGDFLPKKCYRKKEEQGSSIRDEGNGKDDDKREKLWFVLVVMSGVATGFWGVVGSLVLKRSWRHAFFRRAEAAYDWVYVIVALRMAKLNNS